MYKTSKKIFIISFIFVIVLGLSYFSLNIKNYNQTKKADTLISQFTLESHEDNTVLLNFTNSIGIKQIECPNGTIIYCNGKKNAAIDYNVEANKTYNFKIIDTQNSENIESFITPKIHIEISKKDFQLNMEQIKNSIISGLNKNLIATNFAQIGIGEENSLDSESTDMATIFNKWSSFGDGDWSYNASTKTIKNSKNSDYFTGYYNPNDSYDDIELNFNAMSTDPDDDIIGAMIRFNSINSNNYSSYLFLLDNHEYNNGINNGAWNGLNKIVNNRLLTTSYIQKLSINPNLKWTRNVWQNYKLLAKGNKIEAYIDDELVSEVTDDSISSGSYGFLTYSQSDTYFKDFKIKTNKAKTLDEVLSSIDWKQDELNVVININNSTESSLSSQNCIDFFNKNNLSYIGITSSESKENVEQFLSNINNNGLWIDNSDQTNYINESVSYLTNLISNKNTLE